MKLDSLEIPRTYPKEISTDTPEAGDVIERRYDPVDDDRDPTTYDVTRRVPVRYILVTVESSGIEFGKVIDRIEGVANVLEAVELTQ